MSFNFAGYEQNNRRRENFLALGLRNFLELRDFFSEIRFSHVLYFYQILGQTS